MKTHDKPLFKVCSIILTILLLVQVFPISAFAEEAAENTVPTEDDAELTVVGGLNQIGPEATEEPTILGELEDLRDECVKHFRLSDGTVAAARYAIPVHTMVGGRWQNIDNTLSLINDETDATVYTTALRSVVYPQKLGGESETAIEAKAGEYAVTLLPDMPGKKAASAKVIDTKSTSDDPYAVPNLLNHVEYNFSNALTLAYEYSPACLKESIILNKKPDSAVFSFKMDFGGLVPVLETDGSVTLYTDSTKTVAQAVLMAPFMEDAEGAISREIQVTLEKTDGGYRYTLTANDAWLNASGRTYPVVIDPTLWLDIDRNDLVDCYADDSQPSQTHSCDYYLYAGMNCLGTTRTYMKVANLPALPVGSVICDAQYYLWQDQADLGAGTQTNYITAHEVLASWSSTTLTWNNQPNVNDKVIDYCAITTGLLHEYRFDITRLAKSWYEGGTNYGIMLKTRDESLTKRARFYSTSTSQTDAFPHILVTYRSNKGLESYWSTTDFSAGSAGTAHVHDYSGALTFELPLAASSGEIAPVSLVGYFNSYESNVKYPGNTGMGNDVNNIKTSIGRGFRLNVQQTVITSDKYGLTGDAAVNYPYVYTDGDGTEHYIVKHTEGSTTTYVDEDGLGLTLTLGSGNTSYVLKDDKNNQLQFNSQGNLCKTVDSNGNAVTISFLPANTTNGILAGQRISSVTDGSGHTFTFTYYQNADGTESGYVTKITVAGAETQFSFSGGLLQNVSYANGMTTVLRYDDAQLSEVQDTNQYLLHFFYTTGTPWPQISLVKGKQYGDTYYSKATGFDRTGYNVLVVRTVGKNSTYNDGDDILTTYQFDNYGKAVTVQARTAGDTNSGVVSINYGAAVCNYTPNYTPNDSSSCRTCNRVASSASLGKNIVNLLKNGNAESTTNWSNYLRDGVTASLGTTHYMGKKSLQFTCSQATSTSLGYWYQDYTGMTADATYTFSAYVKTADMSPVAGQGAYVAVKAWGGTEEPTYSSQYLTDNGNTGINNGWRRLTASITVPVGTTHLRVYAGFAACNGTVNFDCLQLEKASVAGSFNLLENPSFERYSSAVPESWTAYNITNTQINTSQHKEGSAGVQISGSPDLVKKYSQSVPVDGNRDETYIISGWAKANAILPDAHSSTVPRFNISIRVTYQDSSGDTCTEDKTPASFNPTVTGWQYTAQAFTLAHSSSPSTYTPTQITIILRYDYECNTAWFDFVQLTRDVASSYVYDTNGNLTTVKANAEQQSGLTYSPTTKDLTSYTDALGYTTNYTYDSAHNLTQTKSPRGVYTNNVYNSNGNVTSTTVRNSTDAMELVCSAEYNTAGTYVTKTKNEDGKGTTYNYNTSTGFLNSVTAPNTALTTYTAKNPVTDLRLKSVTSKHGSSDAYTKVGYTYTGSRLTGLTYGRIENSTETTTDSYVFTYNKFGDPVSTKVGGVTLSTNTYVANSGLLEYTTYGNGTRLGYDYDYLGRVTGVKNCTGTADNYRYTWTYAGDDTVRQHRDGVNGKKYRYDYDSIGRLNRYDVFNNSTDAYIGSSQFGYDKRNNLTSVALAMDGKICTQKYYYSPISGLSDTTDYAKDNLPTRYQMSSGIYTDYTYDTLNRVKSKTLHINSATLKSYYNYKLSDRNTADETLYRTTMVASEILGTDGFKYSYEPLAGVPNAAASGMGYITLVQKGSANTAGTGVSNAVNYRSYTYNALGELTSESFYDSAGSNPVTYAYSYDRLGNITGQIRGSRTINYTYGTSSSAGWGKMLNAVSVTENGNTTTENIVYDQIGNPTTYRNASLTWFGRQLTNYSKSGTAVAYTYDADGLRGKKMVNGTLSTYQYVNGHLAYENRGGVKYFYFYDSFGKLASIRFYDPSVSNGSAQNYFTLTNQQGDVVAIYNTSGLKVADYEYDAWGNIISTTDSSNVNIATRNPFRYRGYYYDSETGLYYVSSRYYDPEIGRWINADDSECLGAEGEVLSYNLFAYCLNNPVNRTDVNGNWSLPNWAKKTIAAVAVVAVVAAIAAITVATAGTGTAIVAVAVGAAKGAAIGFAVGAVSGVAIGYATTGTLEGTLNGMADGALSGSICGAVTGGVNGYSNYSSAANFLKSNGANPKEVLSSYKGTPKVQTLKTDTTVYRTWGGTTQELGHWASPNNYGSSAQKLLSLPTGNTMTHTSTFLLPKGTTVLSGKAAPLFGQPGGGVQWWIPVLR